MNLSSFFKFLPALIGLATKLIGKSKTPPRRVDEVLGGPNTPTTSEQAKAKADAAADAKYGN